MADSDLMLKTMCNTIPDLIWSKDTKGIYTFVNQAICDRLLSAKNTDEPIGKDDMFFALRERNLHKDNPEWHTFGELCYDSDGVTIEAGKPMQFFEYGNIKGKFLYFDVRKAPLRDDSGNIIGVVGTARDITQERLRDLELTKLSQAIKYAGESFMITNTDGTIEYVNPAFTAITGYTYDEAIGKNPRILKSGKQAPEYYERLWKTITSGEVWHSSVIDCRKDGTQYPAIMSIAPIFDNDHQITHYVGIQQDMSEHKILEEKFRQAQKMEAMGTMVGGIAHDFNNMLAGMTGNLYLAKKKSSDNPDVVKKIESVEKLSFQASDMIKQLLTFARKGILEVKPFGLTSFIKEVSKLCESSIPENIKFTQDICCKELVINGDVTQLQQVILNLINNARDAVSGVPHPEVSLILSEFEADCKFRLAHPNVGGKLFAHLAFHDNGIGISDKDLKHIFEPFYTTKEVGVGTGLGLPMAYGAIQSHGGAIDVVTKEKVGTTFNIYLPLQEETTASITPSTHTEKALMGNGELILLVDDEEKVRSTGKEVLESLGYRVVEASNGLKAYDVFLLNQMDISLIIMDVVMPVLGGVEAVERIKTICPSINIIYATGYDKDESLKSAMPVDGSVVLSKPYHIATLSKTIRSLLATE